MTLARKAPHPRHKASGVLWLGDLPSHWQIKRTKYAVDPLRQKTNNIPEDPFYVAMENIESWTGRLLPGEQAAEPEGVVGTFQSGDVLFGKLRPYLAKALLAERDGYCSTELLALGPKSVHSGFLLYWMLNSDFVREVDGSTYGSKMPRANWEFIGNLPIAIPPFEEQRAIAAFLDRETVRIDALIDKKRRLIDLLREQRQALITSAVIRGINPAAELRDSGLETVGPIPRHWLIYGLTKAVARIVDYRGATPEKTPSGVFLITTRNIRDGRIDYQASQEFVDEDDFDEIMRRGKPVVGEVLFTMEAPLGQAANLDREDVAIAQRIIKISAKRGLLDHYYLKYWILGQWFQQDVQSYATGSTASGIKASKLPQLKVAVPPLEEQREIVQFLDCRTERVDNLIAKVSEAIGLLIEARSSLISSAVTGKLVVH